MKTNFLILLFFGCIFVVFSYTTNEDYTDHQTLVENIIIDKPGKYTSKDKNLVLEIKIQKAIVKYFLSDTTNRLLFASAEPRASDVQKWHFILVSDELWFDSSDIGLFILRKDTIHNQYDLYNFGMITEKNVNTIPKIVFENMPSSVRKRFNPSY